MKILNYTKEHTDFRKMARAFMEKEIIPNIQTWEANHDFPRDMWYRLGEAGLLCTTVPVEYGGAGRDLLYDVIVGEELLRADSSCGGGVVLHSWITTPYIAVFGSEEQKKKYLPKCVSGECITAVGMTEPGAGSDLTAITTTAVEDGDDVIINGTKIFISCAVCCGLVVLAARDPEIENPYEALSLYLVEEGTPGFTKGVKYDKMGLHTQDTGELIFTNCRIPKTSMLGKKGAGFKMLMRELQQERLSIAIMALNAAERVLEETIDHYKNPSSQYVIPKTQVNQFAIAEMTTDITMQRLFLDKLVEEHMKGSNIVVETSMAKYKMTELSRDVCDRCIDLHGDFGGTEACIAVKYLRDVRSMSIFAGTNEIMRQIISKFMKL